MLAKNVPPKAIVRLKRMLIAWGIVLVCAFIPVLAASFVSGGERRDFSIKARQYAFDPPRIIVTKGDEVHIRLSSSDVIHGFYLEGHDIDALIEPNKPEFKLRHPSEGKEFISVEEIVFTADRPGKFRFRCSRTCGTLHPFMQGELIVRPNYPFLASVGAAVGVCIAMFVMLFLEGKRKVTADVPPKAVGEPSESSRDPL